MCFFQLYELIAYKLQLVDEHITILCIFILSWIKFCLNQKLEPPPNIFHNDPFFTVQPLLHTINNPQQLHDQTEASQSQHKQSTLLFTVQPLLHTINNPQQLHDQTEASQSQHKQSTLLICEVYIFDQHGFHDWRLLFPRLVGFVALWLVTLCNHPSNAGQGLGQGNVWSQLLGEDAMQWLDEPGAWWSPPCKVTCCQMKGKKWR